MEDARQALVKEETAITTAQLQHWDPQQPVVTDFMLSISVNGSTLAVAGSVGMVTLGSLSC
jgi:hypothetical protein